MRRVTVRGQIAGRVRMHAKTERHPALLPWPACPHVMRPPASPTGPRPAHLSMCCTCCCRHAPSPGVPLPARRRPTAMAPSSRPLRAHCGSGTGRRRKGNKVLVKVLGQWDRGREENAWLAYGEADGSA